MRELIREKGIILEHCPPYDHDLNGIAERYNTTAMNSARCLLSHSKMNITYCPEIAIAVAYLRCGVITNTVEMQTPIEISFKWRLNIENLKLHGCKAFTRVTMIKRRSKWDIKADAGILIVYANTGYRVLTNSKVIVAVTQGEKLLGFNGEYESDGDSIENVCERTVSEEIHENGLKDDEHEKVISKNKNEDESLSEIA
ncbi:Copia protein [Eufriesea mexicana]|uniref:Copia protein n=1 Tax=Eufriesea mexicana TaxID=516756 RepID=A0A310ST76_9HYME|nr:Copia protein [Eufriesea mexicana]